MSKPYSDLRSTFGRCTQQAYFPHFDVYLMTFDRGTVHGEENRYSLVWKSRLKMEDKENSFVEYSGNDKKQLSLKFHDACHNVPYSENEFLNRVVDEDVQREQEYNWENGFLMGWETEITIGNARKIARRIAEDYNVSVPIVSYDPKAEVSEYVDGKIVLSDLTLQNFLHESGHMILQEGDYGDSLYISHGPYFVWKIIELYSRYGGVPVDYLVATATEHDLLGDLSFNRMMSPKSIARTM